MVVSTSAKMTKMTQYFMLQQLKIDLLGTTRNYVKF